MENIDFIFLYRFFIRDVRSQLIENQCRSPVKVYRTQRMFNHELKQLRKYIHRKISINSFFSTSQNRQYAEFLLCEPVKNSNTDPNNTSVASTKDDDDPDAVLTGEVSVLLEIDADPSHVVKEKSPFADIAPFSEFGESEQEILFMIGTVFRIEGVKEEQNGIWIISLSLCDDEVEHEIVPISNAFKNEYKNSTENDRTGVTTLCSFLLDMGKLDTVEALVKRTLYELPSNDILNKAKYYYQLGTIALHRHQYDIGLRSFNDVVKLLPKDHRLMANTYIAIGNAHRYGKHFSRAMKSYETALAICEENNKEDQLVIATCYVNIGSWYRVKRHFDKALEYYQKALVIREKYISFPHFTIGHLHMKLAEIYLDRSQAELAVPHYCQALEICSKYLPRDHPLLSKAYRIAALTHQNFDTGRETIEFFDRACVTDYRNSSLPNKWKPLGIKLFHCPRCGEMVWIYNVFGVFYGWSCFACVRKLITRRPVNAKIDRDSFKQPDGLIEQRILQKSYAFHKLPNEPPKSLLHSNNQSDEGEYE
jgi:tetratricopeptide (TPR) repeat protein